MPGRIPNVGADQRVVHFGSKNRVAGMGDVVKVNGERTVLSHPYG